MRNIKIRRDGIEMIDKMIRRLKKKRNLRKGLV
jgi:hypothetical protein